MEDTNSIPLSQVESSPGRDFFDTAGRKRQKRQSQEIRTAALLYVAQQTSRPWVSSRAIVECICQQYTPRLHYIRKAGYEIAMHMDDPNHEGIRHSFYKMTAQPPEPMRYVFNDDTLGEARRILREWQHDQPKNVAHKRSCSAESHFPISQGSTNASGLAPAISTGSTLFDFAPQGGKHEYPD